MSNVGIICEFNPFHNGHKYLIDSVKKDGDAVICVMSGNFVQRGESAIFDKRIRTKSALLCGADLVIELPVAYSVAGAQTFARGGVKLLDSLGLVDFLAFGSECGDTQKLADVANTLENPDVQNKIHEFMKSGITFAAARERAVCEIYGEEFSNTLQNSNDILAVEYISALNILKSEIKPVSVKRTGVSHDGEYAENEFASASYIREMIKNGECAEKYIPEKAYGVLFDSDGEKILFGDYGKLDLPILAFLRKATPEDFKHVPDVSEGIENRIINAAKSANSLFDVFDNAKTKRYTHARIRRIVLNVFLGIKNSDISCGMPYIRVLGFSEKGKEILRLAKNKSTLPVVMRAGDVSQLGEIAQRTFKLECTATDIFNLTLQNIRPCGTEMTDNIVITD